MLRQTLRGALGSIDKHRQSVVSHHLQHAPAAGNANKGGPTGNRAQKRVYAALAKASITMSFHNDYDYGDGADGTSPAMAKVGATTGMGFHELAAQQLVSVIWFSTGRAWCITRTVTPSATLFCGYHSCPERTILKNMKFVQWNAHFLSLSTQAEVMNGELIGQECDA